jgi:ribosome-associated protein
MQIDDDTPHDDEEYDARPSKSARKRDAEALQTLGTQLTELRKADLARLTLPEVLLHAIQHYQALTTHESKRRQRQYIGKIMRKIDAEPIKQALDALNQDSHRAKARFKRLEQLRDRLVADPDGALNEVITHYPQADRQQVRALARKAMQELREQRAPTAARALFKYLSGLDDPLSDQSSR